MTISNSSYEFTLLVARYKQPLEGAAIAANVKTLDNLYADPECFHRRDVNERGRFRRVVLTDEINRVFAGLDTVSDPNMKQLWLRILDGTYLLHIQVLPPLGLENLHKQLRIPKTIEQLVKGEADPDRFDFTATGQLSMLDRIEGTAFRVDDTACSKYRPVVLLYETRGDQLVALHLVEYSETTIETIEPIWIEGDRATDETHSLPPTPTPRPRYTEDDDGMEVSFIG